MLLPFRPRYRLGFALGALAFAAGGAAADPIRHPTAIFAGLDKTTGRIINFDVAIEETVQFGALQVTPRVCNTRPQTETPQTTSFVEVDELILKSDQRHEARPEPKADGKQEAKRIFSGWMFAASPGLHGVEHPVYDVWLVDCKGGKEVAQPAAAPAPAPDAATPPPEGGKKRRSRTVEPTAPAPVENQPIGPADQPTGGAVVEPSAQAPPAAAEPDAGAEPAKPAKKKKKKKQRAPDAEPAGNPLLPF
jgi:hypothetical protein